MKEEKSRSESTNSLVSQIVDILIKDIREGEYKPGAKLPTENQIAAKYKISRATVRRAFDRLEALGLIQRRQGVGTFLRRTSNISNPLNHFLNFSDLIREQGSQPGFSYLNAKIISPTMEIMQNLSLSKGQRVLFVEKVFFADDIPIIYCINYIPTWVFESIYSDEEAIQPDLIEPDFINFFDEKCHQPILYFISDVYTDILENCNIPKFFPTKEPNTPVLVISEIGYNEHDRPVVHSIEYHPGNLIKFKLIRSRPDLS